MPHNYSFQTQPFSTREYYNKHTPVPDGTFLNGIFAIKDGIDGGYPFVECILSVLPFCDKVLLNDGGSTDGTLQYLNKIKSMFPNKIELYKIQDKFTKNWRSIDYELNFLINQCKSEWIFEIQGDEILDPENAQIALRELHNSNNFNAIRHSRLDFVPHIQNFLYDMRTVRFIKNIPDLTSFTGGDDFHIGKHSLPRENYTLHNIPPERDVYSFVLKHYIRMFPANVSNWIDRHGKSLASDNTNRVSMLQKQERYINFSRNKSIIYDHVPNILKGIIPSDFYFVRDELFDENWLSQITNLDYRNL